MVKKGLRAFIFAKILEYNAGSGENGEEMK